MAMTIWIVSPLGYPHSQAFDEVAIALSAAFRVLGKEVPVVRDTACCGDTSIVLGCNMLHHVRAPSSRLILFNLEQITPESPWLSKDYLVLLKNHTVWDYSERNIAELARLGIRATQCGIGYIEDLTRIAPTGETIDVLFVGSFNKRRENILRQLLAAGARVEAHFNVYGKARDDLIAHSKLVLNVHFYESRVFEIVRVSYLLANRRCVVSETGFDPSIEEPLREGIAFAEYRDLVETCLKLLRDKEKRQSLAEAGFKCFSAQPQIEYLRQALAASGMSAFDP
jgi:hypothetical protein